MAVAQLELGEHLFGCPVNKKYRPIPGEWGRTLFPSGVTTVVRTPKISQTRMVFKDPNELRATLTSWDFASRGADLTSDTRYAVYRVFETTHVIEYEDPGKMREPPLDAQAYISKITYGYLHETVFFGDKTKFHTGAITQFNLAHGNIHEFGDRYGLHVEHISWGLAPAGSVKAAVFATTEAEIQRAYVREYVKPVPIFVEYTILPDAEFRDGLEIDFRRPPVFEKADYRIKVVTGTVYSTRLDGRVWDNHLSGLPDPEAEVYLHACRDLLFRTKAQNNTYKPVWTDSTVARLSGSDRLCIRVFDEDKDEKREEIGACETRDLASERYFGNKIIIEQCGRIENVEIRLKKVGRSHNRRSRK